MEDKIWFLVNLFKMVKVAILVFLIIMFVTFVVAGILSYPDLSETTLKHFFDSSQWVEIFIGTLTLAITTLGIYSIVQIKEQTKISKHEIESKVYRPLISDRFQSIKRFIHSNEVQLEFKKLNVKIRALEIKMTKSELTESEKQNCFKQELNALREKIYYLGYNFNFPLLDKKPSLDHIESLLNEYNYISLLLNQGVINPRFGTDLSIKNFTTIYLKTKPFIELRKRISKNYASHFIKFVETEKK